MSELGSNIRHLRKQQNLNQEQLATALGIKRSRIGAYEEGRAEPSIDLLKKIAQYFSISLDTLCCIDLTKAGENKLLEIGQNRVLFPMVLDNELKDTIEVVTPKTAAGYLQGYTDPEYVEDLQRFNLPFIPTGKHRAFPIKGDSMPPVNDGSFVVGRFLEDLDDICNGETYVVLTKDDGLVYKRIYNRIPDDGTLHFHSDNKNYIPYKVHPEDVLEIWEYAAHINVDKYEAEELNKASIANMFRSLQIEIETLKKTIDSLQT